MGGAEGEGGSVVAALDIIREMAKSLVADTRGGGRVDRRGRWARVRPGDCRNLLADLMFERGWARLRPDRAAPIARGQSSPGLYHWNVPYGDGSVVIPHGSHDFRNGCAVPQIV